MVRRISFFLPMVSRTRFYNSQKLFQYMGIIPACSGLRPHSPRSMQKLDKIKRGYVVPRFTIMLHNIYPGEDRSFFFIWSDWHRDPGNQLTSANRRTRDPAPLYPVLAVGAAMGAVSTESKSKPLTEELQPHWRLSARRHLQHASWYGQCTGWASTNASKIVFIRFASS